MRNPHRPRPVPTTARVVTVVFVSDKGARHDLASRTLLVYDLDVLLPRTGLIPVRQTPPALPGSATEFIPPVVTDGYHDLILRMSIAFVVHARRRINWALGEQSDDRAVTALLAPGFSGGNQRELGSRQCGVAPTERQAENRHDAEDDCAHDAPP